MLPRVRTNWLTGYAVPARSAGLDPAALAAGVGPDVADLDVAAGWIPAAPAVRLLERSAQQADCPDFGLRLAGFGGLGSLGPLGVVLREEPDLGSVVDLLIGYARAYDEALHLRLRNDDGQAMIEVSLDLGEPAPTDQALDLMLGTLVGVVRALVRTDWEPRSAFSARPCRSADIPWTRWPGRSGWDPGRSSATWPGSRRASRRSCTPGARLSERYLSTGRYTLTEVSQLLGLSAPSSFTRWFRQQYGTSPTEWRRAARSASRMRTGRGRTVPGG